MNLIDTLRADAEALAESVLPTASEAQRLFGALLIRLENAGVLKGDPDPEPATAPAVPIQPDGAQPPVGPDTSVPSPPAAEQATPEPTDTIQGGGPAPAQPDGGVVTRHDQPPAPSEASRLDRLEEMLAKLIAPHAPTVTTSNEPHPEAGS